MPDPARRTYHCRVDELKRLCMLRGWSLDQLARKAGINSRTLRRIMKGGASYLKTISLLATKLGVSPAALVDGHVGEPPQDKPARFKLHLQLQGRFRSEQQKNHLIRLTPEILRSLEQEGIVVTGQKSAVVTSRLSSGLAQWRLLIGITARTNGRQSWVLAAVVPSRLPLLFKAASFSRDNFEFGEVVATGWGRRMDIASLQRAAQLYKCSPTDVLDLCVLSPPHSPASS